MLYICLLCDEVLLAWYFGNPGFNVNAPQDPHNMKQKSYFGYKLKSSYQIASLFDMYIDMGTRIAGKQDRPSLIIEAPPQGPQMYFLDYCPYMKTGCWSFSLVVHMYTNKFWLCLKTICSLTCTNWNCGLLISLLQKIVFCCFVALFMKYTLRGLLCWECT